MRATTTSTWTAGIGRRSERRFTTTLFGVCGTTSTCRQHALATRTRTRARTQTTTNRRSRLVVRLVGTLRLKRLRTSTATKRGPPLRRRCGSGCAFVRSNATTYLVDDDVTRPPIHPFDCHRPRVLVIECAHAHAMGRNERLWLTGNPTKKCSCLPTVVHYS